MLSTLTNTSGGWGFNGYLLIPLLITVWIAWGDIRTRRIPNYLTLGTALAGLGFQLGCHGWNGLVSGLLGLFLGLGLLLIPYILEGMGAGDVKALAAMGAWLGPFLTFWLFVYMALAGGLIAVAVLWWKGLLWSGFRRAGVFIINWLLCRQYGMETATSATSWTEGIPYGVALALGMMVLVMKGE